MTSLDELARKYGLALGEYLATGNEAGLEQAYTLGRKALDSGLGLLDMAAIHREALLRVVPGIEIASVHKFPFGNEKTLELACYFFEECLAPFEMTQRGFKETNEQLRADIAERQRTEERLKQLVDDLARSNRDLEQFAYISSHDLQEPLRQVSGFVEMLERHHSGVLDEQAKEFMGFITEGANRMSVLIRDLLAYSRIGRTDKAVQVVDVAKVAQDTLKSLRLRLEETNAKVTVDELPSAQGNETMLGQLFQNLIGNALKFRGEEPPQIHIGCRREDGHWLFCVRDNGIGFAQESAERIFEVFKRLHNRENYEGTGIGLAICRRVVELHGGRIWAESEPGKGAAFYFTLPARN